MISIYIIHVQMYTILYVHVHLAVTVHVDLMILKSPKSYSYMYISNVLYCSPTIIPLFSS